MARNSRTQDAGAGDGTAPETTSQEETQDQKPEDAPEGGSDGDSDGEEKPERAKVPLELRPVFNEISRLSGMLAIARRAAYDGRSDRVLGALELLEEAVPAARKMASLTTD